ncbi:ATP-binding cassette domain-containing protein [Nitratifractor salsuginis]|uniref:ABC transporter related protein n=1 Tax=Nitratifractor salsuginis (strain DSM 16511 / JCM 12458 / E9I37-1) TaxID=749222 RepID=E6X0G9_NITSE|nr:ATP-binding cassette domain-containing protein [Nitratifractor salsuginis]ADV46819.1 ABC transporter related protein [Nitratifractor salsuginis DSM 16511]
MIRVETLKIYEGERPLVDLNFELKDSLALVGQSGSGKSLTLKALLGMLPSNLRSELKISAPFGLVRGWTLSFVPQNPFTALSPLTKIRKQWFASEEKARELFALLGLEWSLFDRYPPQLSGGQLQRIIFAVALSSDPKLILLDEPTTALDPHLREEVARILVELQKRFAFSMLFVTHDINLAAKICRETLVIREGRKVEAGPSEVILAHPRSDYTRRLLEASFARREFRR